MKDAKDNRIIGGTTGKEYYATIGLEIHAEMKTQTKMFCKCKNDPFNATPNTHICPVCTGQPGALPYVNKQACKNVMRVGAALGSDLADFSEFDRKNYFYPDIPKAYQISQYQYPLVSKGSLAGVGLERIHMEEDTATSIHKAGYSLVDYNRSSVPLMELVTLPVIHDAMTAVSFAKELQLLLRTLGVSDANLEKGEMRIEANISISTHKPKDVFDGDFSTFGTKTEVKNLNSFKVVGQAIDFEIARHLAILEGEDTKGEIVQETRGWDENKQATFSQRTKESADDYRYFPDPDIPKYKFSELPEFSKEALTQSLPELPWEKRERYAKDFGIKSEDIEFYLQNPLFDTIFNTATKELKTEEEYKKLSNYISSDIAGFDKNEEGSLENIKGEEIAQVIQMITQGELSSRGAKDAILVMYQEGGTVKDIADKKGLIQKSDPEELKKLIQDIIANNAVQAAAYKAGEEKLLQYFVGQGMKETKGSANPGILAKLFKEMLGS
jgi:aspartyl-tRNA(Asn)/glutamyl-tRNA(Gln) amidotransferase subunit B